LSGQPSELEHLVRSKFSVKEFYALPEGEFEFQVIYGRDTKQNFAQLRSQIAPWGYRPELTGSKDECALMIRKAEPPETYMSRLPVLLALFTLASLVVVALLQQMVYEQLQPVPSIPGYLVFFEFGGTIAVLMGAHELGRRLASRKGEAGRANSYLIPGVPFLPPFLPSLGFASTQREPALNRDTLFDAVIAGPLAVVLLAMFAYIIGDLTAVIGVVPPQLSSTTVSVNSNAIQMGLDYILGPFGPSAPAGYVLVSPIADGATVGFILAFIGLLPMTIYDGGFLSSIAWGERAARATTYLSVLLLLLIDMNNATYWAVAIVALLLAGRPVRLKLLDDVSALSSTRQWVLIGTLVLALLCLPVPHSLATFPLP
jgi:hypothetical protein